MILTLQLSIPNFKFQSSSPKLNSLSKLHRLHSLPSSSSSSPVEDSEHGSDDKSRHRVILVERYGNGTLKRYILDDESRLKTVLEEHKAKSSDGFSLKELSWLPDAVKDFVLPAGFPGSVSDDYLDYMLLQFPTNVTGWICHTLVTSSLLKAVGLGSLTGTTVAASAAAISEESGKIILGQRWVSKDGIGAVGRLFIGGRFGSLFDDDPKQWRMYADFIGSAGSIFDLCTPLYPAYFLPLASLGNLTKAVARGLKDPSFRVIQSHFAISSNLGDVAAKEEVWEVSAQLVGLSLGVLILATPGLLTSYPILVFTWMSIRLVHLGLRYQSLSILQFNTINLKRARILVNSHVSNSTVPGCLECNKMENILSWERFSKPNIVLGVPLDEVVSGERSGYTVKELLKLYSKEKYILVVNQQRPKDFEVSVSLKEGATSLSVLRSVWQTYWLYKHTVSPNNMFDQIEQSLNELEGKFENFLQQLREVGWDTDQISLKVYKDVSIEEFGSR